MSTVLERVETCMQALFASFPSSCRCSQAGTSNAKAAGASLPHGTMRRDSSQAVSRQCSHHPTARHEGGSAAL